MIYPKIGIRPVIDGRLGGVRESLEATTLQMAKEVSVLYAGTLKYPIKLKIKQPSLRARLQGIHKNSR